ncbi:unnamed protein product [Calypogeia fissa]
MRTIGLLLREQLRGRGRHHHRCSPQLTTLLPSGTCDSKLGTLSRVNNHDHDRQAVDGFAAACAPCAHHFSGRTPQIFCNAFRTFHSTPSSGYLYRNTKEWKTYDPLAFAEYYRYRPLRVAYRTINLILEVFLLSFGHLVEKDIHRRAENLRRTLIRLGAFYVKLGQALSTRPDILPSVYCEELAKLQDHVPPYSTSDALAFLESQLGLPAAELYAYITPEPVAAASLGQVYKARLNSGEMVAVKVQRPGVTDRLALDSYLLGLLGGPLQRFGGARSDLIAMITEVVERMFEEIDYVREGNYAERFNKLYGTGRDDASDPEVWYGLKRVQLKLNENHMEGIVKVPKIYWDLTSRGVLTMEWVDGLKLTDKEALKNANLDVQSLVDQGVFCSLRQLLEEGFFHADPHPGNLLVTKEGVLAYFDFGMMSELPRQYRIGLIRTIVHFVNRDSLGLAEDFKVLGFISKDSDTAPIAQALGQTFEVEGITGRLDFQGIMAQLSDVMYQFKFRLPPEYAMVIRALGALEGTATTLDPGFKVVASVYPFIIGRLLADPDPAMREILRELLIRNNGSIRWHRLERLVFAIAEQQSTSTSEDEINARGWGARDGLGQRAASGIRGAFNTRAVASAAMDVIYYILSEKGVRIRTLLVQDITKTFDHFLQQYIAQMLDVDEVFKDSNKTSRGQDMQGFQSAASNPNVCIHQQDIPQRQAHQPLGWSHYTSASYWGGIAARKVAGEFLWRTHSVAEEVDKSPHVGKSTEKFSTDGGQDSDSNKGKDDSSSDSSGVDDFTRFKVGFQAFANAVNSSPEIWIPLFSRLACNAEARSLAAAVTSSLCEIHCRRTSEASFLLMSKALHKCGKSGFQGQQEKDYSKNKV